MSERVAFQAAREAEQADMDQLRRGFARQAVAIVKASSTDERGRFDALSAAIVIFALEPALDGVYGRFPGDEASLLLQHVVKHTGLAWSARIAAAAADVRRRLRTSAPDLLRAIEREAV